MRKDFEEKLIHSETEEKKEKGRHDIGGTILMSYTKKIYDYYYNNKRYFRVRFFVNGVKTNTHDFSESANNSMVCF